MIGTKTGMTEHEISLIAHKILKSFIRDISIFSEYSVQFDNRFTTNFQKKIDYLDHLDPLIQLEKQVELQGEKITNYIGHYRPILNIAEGLLHKSMDENDLKGDISDFYIPELRSCIRRREIWETLRFSRLFIKKIEANIDHLVSKDVFLRIIEDIKLFTQNLHTAELEYAEAVHQRDRAEIDHAQAREELQDLLDSISESSQKIFKANDKKKLAEYSIEQIMASKQFNNGILH